MPARLVEVTLINDSSYRVHWNDDYCEWGELAGPLVAIKAQERSALSARVFSAGESGLVQRL